MTASTTGLPPSATAAPGRPERFSVVRLLPLAVGSFAVGTAMFVTSGVLPGIAADVGVSVTAAGQMLTVFALCYAVLSPVLAAVTGRLDRRTVLVAALVVFAIGNAVSALTPNYPVLLLSRGLAAAGAAMYSPNASAMAGVLSPAAYQGRAMAVVVGGMTASTALGVPLGTWLGTTLGWRASLWLVAGLAVAAVVALLRMPRGVRLPAVGLAARLRPLGNRRLLLVAAQTLFLLWGCFTVFSYVGAVFGPAAGGAGAMTALLWVWGLMAVAGNVVSGRLADARGPRSVVLVAAPLLVVLTLALQAATTAMPAAVVWMMLFGAVSWLVTVPQQQRAVAVDPGSAAVLLGLNSAALYAGISLGGVTGGAALTWLDASQLGYPAAAVLLVGLLLVLVDRRPPR
ncbi:MFS transporter [Marinactinospora rubrisoli]|uniref:MFS transporter n=1 Tax=Marinactinospora rubrisoli TaxID=2715399 RepID=A0ABW2KLS0_9ACTN